MTPLRIGTFVLSLALAVVWIFATAQPGHGSIQRIPGAQAEGSAPVAVVNQPVVRAEQAGDWRVRVPDGVVLAAGTAVSLDGPSFLRTGRRYTVKWGPAQVETCTVLETARGWARVYSPSGARWINLSLATSIEEAQ